MIWVFSKDDKFIMINNIYTYLNSEYLEYALVQLTDVMM